MRSTVEERVFQQKLLSENVTFLTVLESDFGRFQKYFFVFVSIWAWNRDGKCCQGVK